MSFEVEHIEKKIEDTIIKYNMLKNVNCVIVGVSGGADSMALLSFLEKYSRKVQLKIITAHVNHCLRESEADRDENFVREYCQKNRIILEILKVNVKEIAVETKKSVEECARKLRYDFFNELSAQYDGKIATAHTLSDSVESMFINLSRGTGTAGLCGIPAKRDNIIRPMIALKREETQFFCEVNGIFYVTDSTNLMREYTRNKIRLDVIPQLKQINSEFEKVAQRTMLLLSSDEFYLENIAKKVLDQNFISKGIYNLKNVKNEPFPILSRFIRLAVFEFLKANITAQHIELILNLIKTDSGAVILPQKIKVSVKNEVLLIEKFEKNLELTKNKSVTPLKTDLILTEGSKKLIIKMLSKNEFEKFDKSQFFYAMDYDKINADANFRTRTAGDKFRQAGRGVTKNVRKLFNELKVSPVDRENILLLASQNEVLWINHVGVAECVALTDNTRRVVVIYSE